MELKTSLFCLVALALLCTVYTQDLIDQHQCRSQVDRFYHSLRKWETLDTLQTLASDATFVINADKTYVPYGGEYKGTTQIQNFFNILFNKAILISLKEGSAVMGANDTYGVFTTENYKVRAAINGEGVVFQQESLDLFVFNENCLITKYVKFFDSYAAAKALSENLQSFAEPHLAPKFAGIEEDFAVDRSEAIVLVKAFYRLAATYPDKITQIMSKMGTIVFPGSSQTIPFAGQWINKFEEIDDYITKRKALNITREPVAWNGVDTFIISRSRVIHFWKETGVSPKTKNSYTVYVAEVFEIIVSDKGLKIGRITETLDSMPVYRVFREHRCQKTFLDYYSAVHSGDLKAATDLFTADAVVHVPGARELTYTGTFKGKSAITKQLQNFKSQYHMSETFPRTKVKTPEMLVAVLDQSLTTRPSAKNTARTYHRSTGIAMFKFDKQCQIEYLGVFGNNHPAIKASRDQTASYPDAAPLKDAKVPYESEINERAATDLVFEFYRRIQAGQSVENLLTKNAVVYVPGDTSVVPFSGVWHGAKQISRFVSKKRAAVTYTRKPWTPVKGSALTVVSDQGRVLVFWNETGMLAANNRLAYSQGVIDYFIITQQFSADGKPDLKIARLTQYGDTAPVAKAFEDNRPATITTSLLYFILIIVGTALVSFLLATILACCIANRNSDAKHYDKVDNVDLSTNLLQHSNPNSGRSIVPSVHN